MDRLATLHQGEQLMSEARALISEIQIEVRNICTSLQPVRNDPDLRVGRRKEKR